MQNYPSEHESRLGCVRLAQCISTVPRERSCDADDDAIAAAVALRRVQKPPITADQTHMINPSIVLNA